MSKQPNNDVSRAAAILGRKGGRAKVPKGFARMDPERSKEIQRMGGRKGLSAMSPERRKEISRKGVEARLAKKSKKVLDKQ